MDEDDVQIVVRFVIPQGKTELTVSEALSLGYEQSKDAGLGPVWVSEDDILSLTPTKTDVFVMDPFSGRGFDHVTSNNKFKCTVVGPRCLLACLAMNTPVPELNYPMFTAAMKGLVITCSGLDKQQKEKLKNLIEQMAGIYSSAFHDGVTHLVTAKAMSAKYDVAVRKETPVMLPSWIEEVWRVSTSENVSAIDARFRSHKCPAMQGVIVCVSQMNRADKELLRKNLETHGGSYSGVLEMEKTSVLVCTSPAGDKYNYAKKWKIPCVSSSWVFDSIERGYCLATDSYRVDRGKTKASTPTKQDQTIAGLAEVSMCSTILNPDETMATRSIEDTINSTAALGNDAGGLTAALRSKSTADWLAELELGKVKKAGNFLDGCRIYMSGFSEPEQVQLARVLKFAGGVRLTQLVESVSHCVHSVDTSHVASDTSKLLERVPELSAHMVSVQWLVESMRLGRAAPERDYLFPPPIIDAMPPEPLLPPVQTAPTASNNTTQFEKHLLAEYADKKGDNTTGITATEDMSQVSQFLAGMKLNVIGFKEEELQDYTDWITEAGGEVVYTDFDGILDYLIVPVEKIDLSDKYQPYQYKRLVTCHWLDDCLDAGELLPLAYHHNPINIESNLSALNGVVTCISGYSGRERSFLNTLINKLGGRAQELFAKKDNLAKDTVASTHLICPVAEGQKYQAAVKWSLSAVTRDWILACFRELLWVSEKPFLVGSCETYTPGKPLPRESSVEKENLGEDEETMVKDMTIVDHVAPDNDATMVDVNERNEDKLANNVSSIAVPEEAKEDEITFGKKLDESRTPEAGTSRVSRTCLTTVTTPGPAGLDTPTLERLRPKPIDVSNITVTPQRYPESQPSPSQMPRHRSGSDGMSTPETPYGAHWTPNPSPNSRKYYKKVLDNLPRYELSEIEVNQLDRFKAKCQDNDNLKKNTKSSAFTNVYEEFSDVQKAKTAHENYLDNLEAKGVPVVTRDKRSFEDIMEEKYLKQGKSWKKIGENAYKKARMELDNSVRLDESGSPCNIFHDVVLVVSKKLQSQAEEIHKCVEELGGKISWQIVDNATHFVFIGRLNDLSKDFRKAKELGCHIVSPDWVFMCRDERERIPESTFPHTYNPKMRLDLTHDSSLVTPKLNHKSKPATKPKLLPASETRMEESVVERNEMQETVNPKDTTPTDTMKVTEAVNSHLAEIDNLLDSVSNTPRSTPVRKNEPIVLPHDFKEFRMMREKEKDDEEEEPRLESQIRWVDPSEEEARNKMMKELDDMDTQELSVVREAKEGETMDTMGSMNVDNLTELMETEKAPEVSLRKVFLTSGWSSMEPDVAAASEQLGNAELLETAEFDASVTHMLTSRVSRSEKMLCSVAAGKWVLHPSYIHDSLKEGKWQDESKYEWGNLDNNLIENKSTLDWKLATAARKWRLDEGGAFDGMKFILNMQGSKLGAFHRLIQAGGGELLNVQSPFTACQGATHLLSEPKLAVGMDFNSLALKGVPVLKPIYVNDFLTSDNPPSLDDFLIEDFKPFWEKRKRNRISTDTPTNAFKKSKSMFGNP